MSEEVDLDLAAGDVAIAFDEAPSAPLDEAPKQVHVEPQLEESSGDGGAAPGDAVLVLSDEPGAEVPPGAEAPDEEAPPAYQEGPGGEGEGGEGGAEGGEKPLEIKIDAPRSSGLADAADIAGLGFGGEEKKSDGMDLAGLGKPEVISKTHSVPVTMGGARRSEKKKLKEQPTVIEEEEVKTPQKPAFMKRTVSLDTGMNEEKKKEKGMSEDEVFSVRQASMLTMIASSKKGNFIRNKSEESEQQIVVPPRDVLMRMPMYSTPLTLEATNNAYRDFVSRLMNMGFEIGQAEVAVIMTNAESVEHAVEYILQHPDACWHRFKPNEDTLKQLSARPQKQRSDGRLLAEFDREDHCDECGMPYWRHNVDPHGDKIEQREPEVEEVQLHGDLEGRVSMSMATRQEQEMLKESLQNMIANRLKSLQEEEPSEDAQALVEAVPYAPEEEPIDPDYDGPTECCQICFDEKPTSYFFLAPCGHNYCNYCLQEHYRVKVNDADVLKLACIDPKCDREVTDEEFRRFLKDPELVSKYEKFRTNKLIQLNPNARFCPKPNCDGHMIGSRWKPKIECPDCSMQICFNCSQEWHGYFVGCNTQVDLGFSKWALNKDVQKCPKCKIRIEKNEGCNHMTCRSCRYEFCWICRGPYNGSHFEWWNIFGCPGAQYTPRFCRCPAFFPRWLNRVLILVCFLLVVLPLAVVAGVLWMVLICFMFCLRCKTDNMNPCDCF